MTLLYMSAALHPLYQASATLYVNRAAYNEPDTPPDLDISSRAAGQIIDTYAHIVQSDRVLSQAVEEFNNYNNYNLTAESLRDALTVKQVDSTEIFAVYITHTNPETAVEIADITARIAAREIENVIQDSSVRVIDYASAPTRRYAPRYLNNTIMGGVCGILAAVIALTLFQHDFMKKNINKIIQKSADENLNNNINNINNKIKKIKKIKNQKDLSALYGDIKILGEIPADFRLQNLTNTDYYHISPAVREKFEILKNHILDVLSGDQKYQKSGAEFDIKSGVKNSAKSGDKSESAVLLITSAESHESFITLNLAAAFAATKKRIIILNCDFYPSQAQTQDRTRNQDEISQFQTQSQKGLSGLLTNPGMMSAYIAPSGIDHHLDFIAAGPVPPNPVELLQSERMKRVLRELRQNYDYIFLNCPPMQTVENAAVLAPESDGALFIIRPGYSERESVSNAINQLRRGGANILGFILNASGK